MADALDFIGNLSSIAGLIVSVWVLLRVGRISRSYLLQARLPDLRKKLRAHRSKLSTLLGGYPDSWGEMQVELQMCDATLRSLAGKLDRGGRARTRAIQADIAGTSGAASAPPEEELRRIYSSLAGLEREIDNLIKDIGWRPGV
jgi:hypothetical protein